MTIPTTGAQPTSTHVIQFSRKGRGTTQATSKEASIHAEGTHDALVLGSLKESNPAVSIPYCSPQAAPLKFSWMKCGLWIHQDNKTFK